MGKEVKIPTLHERKMADKACQNEQARLKFSKKKFDLTFLK